MDAVRHFHCLVRDRTLRIRKDLPLNGAVDNASHYMACQPDSPSPPSAAASDPITLPTIRVRHNLSCSIFDGSKTPFFVQRSNCHIFGPC